MQMKKLNRVGFTVAAFTTISLLLYASLHSAKATPPSGIICNYFSMQHPEWPPVPCPPVAGLQTYYLSNTAVVMDDSQVDYAALAEMSATLSALESALAGLELPPGAGEGGGGGGSGGADALGGSTFIGNCTGHLLAPLYQVTNVVLTITGATSGDQYDLFTVTNLNVTNWTYLGRWTNAAATWIITNPPPFESYYTIGCVDDADGEGLPDVYEVLVSHTDPNDPDTDYDGRSDSEELVENTLPLNASSFTPVRLGYFRFNTTNWLGERGQSPLVATNLQLADAWITKAVQVTNTTAVLKYRTVETDGKANINLRSGSVRFWFKPLWNSGTGTGAAGKLIEVGSKGAGTTNDWWSLFFNATGNALNFASQTNNMAEVTNLTAGVSFTSNNWYQLVLTYTNGACVLYTNGVLCATNAGSLPYPGLATRTNGFTIGSDTVSDSQAKGVFEDLETFNYPLNANDVLENFQLTQPPDLIPNLRLWLKADAGVVTNAPGNRVDPWRDQSGNANDARQIDVNTEPLYVSNGVNGKPAIYFPGTNYFSLPNALFTNANAAEIFVVLKVETNLPTTGRGLWYMGANNVYYPNVGGTIVDNFCTGGLNTETPSQSLQEPHIYNVVSRTNEWTSRINGNVHYSRNDAGVQFKSSSIRLGNGAGTSFAGHIAEVLLYTRALTPAERLAVGTYLGQRYNLFTNAPAAPTNLTARAVSTNQVSLTWSNLLSDTNISFTVQRRTASGVYHIIATPQNALSYLDSALAAGTQYYYRVKAANYAGESAYVAETNVTTLTTTTAVPLESLKLWLKADCGHGFGAVNCWVDQTTNNNSAYFNTARASGPPRWNGFNTNGHPVLSFFGTNAFELPAFLASATQAEAFVVVRSFGTTASNWASLWWMSAQSIDSRYPYSSNTVWDNFGRTAGAAQFSSGLSDFTRMHLYNPMSKTNEWSAAFNNGGRYVESGTTPSFPPTYSLLGRGASTVSEFLHGEVSEVLIFNRELTAAERGTVSTNYLNKRFNLW
ncbi:MAG: hypothetical protein EXS35_10865 [Pedosphaera sp.]|nr:hypothetical protein [Pedosphaera sp.]